MLLWTILATGFAAGLLPGILKLDKAFSVPNIALGIFGALTGAFLGFGDAPLFLEYPFLNEKTLMIAVAVLLVFVRVAIKRRPSTP